MAGTLKRKPRARSADRQSAAEEQLKESEACGVKPAAATRPQTAHTVSPTSNAMTPYSRRFSETTSRASTGGDENNAGGGTFEDLSLLDQQQKYLNKATSKLKELLDTEKTYVEKNLKEVVEGYYSYIEESKKDPKNHIKIPSDLLHGKDKIVFGNIRAIYDMHKKTVYPALCRSVDDPRSLRTLFESKRDLLKQKYGRFCINKPKSEFIITQHKDKYFAVLRLKRGFEQNLSTQMMTPVQRVTRYQLLLGEIAKYLGMAGVPDLYEDVKRAFEIALEIAEYANDMMTAGRIHGFQGDVTNQGLLLKRGVAECFKRKALMKRPKIRSCQFFVFQETVLICDNPVAGGGGGFTGNFSQTLEYLASFKMNKVTVREVTRPDSTYGFELEKQENDGGGGKSGGHEVMVIVCESELERDESLKIINGQIRDLKDIARRLVNPQSFDKE